MRLLLAVLFSLGPIASGRAQFAYETQGLPSGPGNSSYTESLDFGDVDLDGDWDVIFADGGDAGLDQNRLWVNQGGIQGGVEGSFMDETATRCPVIKDASRDIEFADMDGDGDLDAYSANNSVHVNQASRFWINQGGLQGGGLGFFTDETNQRWVGLAQAGSSIPSQLLVPSGGFIDWSADADFADLDNDGDLDLIHTSDGNLFPGTPSRLFLNDGLGFFSEFNPSGIQLSSSKIPNGTQALWVKGVQLDNSTDPTGATTDIAGDTQDVSVGDLDGDLELDLLLGAPSRYPRLFTNLQGASGGVLGFKDVTFATFQPGFVDLAWQWDQELGDLDGDADLDIYGTGWGQTSSQTVFADRVYVGDGAAGFSVRQLQVPGSLFESEQIDLVDIDGDGDLDVAAAPFTSGTKLFENDGTGFMAVSPLNYSASGSLRHDVESADLDGDGDPDIMLGTRSSNGIAWNVGGTPDTNAPYFGVLEAPEDRVAGTGAFPLRAAVHDNVPFELYGALQVSATASIGDCAVAVSSAKHSGGQVFRAVLPQNLLGTVEVSWRAVDEQGNAGIASIQTYVATTALDVSSAFGLGTASAVTGTEPELACATVPFAGSSLALCLGGAPDAGYLLGIYSAPSTPPATLPSLGIVNLGGVQLVFASGQLDEAGHAVWTSGLPDFLPPGLELFAQVFTDEGSATGDLFACSRGLEVRLF